MNHADRVRRLLDSVERPLLVSSLTNVQYLTGFTGSNAFVIASPEGMTFITDGRYGEVAEALVAAVPDTELVVYRDGLPDVIVGAVHGDHLDVEANHITWDLVRSLDSRRPGLCHATKGTVERFRRTKEPAEVEALRAAAAAGDAAFAQVEQLHGESQTEADLADALVAAMRGAGAEAADWEPIVAQGANAARPHHRAGPTPLGDGVLLLDYGCVVDGYHSDMTRTLSVGHVTDPEFDRVYEAVLASNQAGIAATRPGAGCHDVDEACRAVLREYGYEDRFVHSTGHGVGLDIHEEPSLRRNSKQELTPGDVVTVEPGVYLPGRFGVRIEDMVLVTDAGNDVLTRSTTRLA